MLSITSHRRRALRALEGLWRQHGQAVGFNLAPTDFNPTSRIAFIKAPDGVRYRTG